MGLVNILFTNLVGTDPSTDVNTTTTDRKPAYWDEGIVQQLINRALDKGEKFVGADGLEGLLRCNVTLDIGSTSSNVWPGFSLNTAAISRLCACGVDSGSDPYISDVPDAQCDLNTTNDLTAQFTATLNPDEWVIIVKHPFKKRESWIEDIYIFQVSKDAWEFRNDSSLRGFRDKQMELRLYARHYTVENCTGESCRDYSSRIHPSFSLSRSAIICLNVVSVCFIYQPLTCDRRTRR